LCSVRLGILSSNGVTIWMGGLRRGRLVIVP